MRDLTKAVALIKKFEGCKLKAYKDPVGIWTIGYGQTGANIKRGLVITQATADEWLAKDLSRRGAALEKLLSVRVSDHQFGALLSFAYNLGLGFVKRSALLKLINDGALDREVVRAFGHYNHAGGKVLLGLTRRRAAEAELWWTV